MALWGKTDAAGSKPKYLTTAEKENVYGVDSNEEAVIANKQRGMQHPGWVKYTTYTDAQGVVRKKAETLVAFSSMTGDAADDAILVDASIIITAQPQNQLGVQNVSPATFSVSVDLTPANAPLSYQWQKQESGTGPWTNIAGATSSSYTTGNLTVAADSGDKYRVVLTSGGVVVNSTEATLTVSLP